jgi:hypothetical protein
VPSFAAWVASVSRVPDVVTRLRLVAELLRRCLASSPSTSSRSPPTAMGCSGDLAVDDLRQNAPNPRPNDSWNLFPPAATLLCPPRARLLRLIPYQTPKPTKTTTITTAIPAHAELMLVLSSESRSLLAFGVVSTPVLGFAWQTELWGQTSSAVVSMIGMARRSRRLGYRVVV